jgi:hypothetical protein
MDLRQFEIKKDFQEVGDDVKGSTPEDLLSALFIPMKKTGKLPGYLIAAFDGICRFNQVLCIIIRLEE